MDGNPADFSHTLSLYIDDKPVATSAENNQSSEAASLSLLYRGVLESNSELEIRIRTEGANGKIPIQHMHFGYREFSAYYKKLTSKMPDSCNFSRIYDD